MGTTRLKGNAGGAGGRSIQWAVLPAAFEPPPRLGSSSWTGLIDGREFVFSFGGRVLQPAMHFSEGQGGQGV